MLKKTITYTDFNDDEVSEDFYFHLSKAELVELEVSHKGGLSESMKKIIQAEDGKAIIAEFKNIILMSYGKRSDDGRRFIKNAQLREEFESSEAYSTLFFELCTNAEKASEFINGIIPKNLTEDVAKITGADLTVVPEPKSETITKAEAQRMTKAEFDDLSTDKLRELAPRIASGEIKIVD